MFLSLAKDFARAVVWAVAFGLVYTIFQILLLGRSSTSPSQNSTSVDTDRRINAYDAQMKKTEALLERSSKYYDRMEENAAKQEELTKRAETVISHLEKH